MDFPTVLEWRGNLSFIEESSHCPFPFERVYWIYDVPGGRARGGHAYKENEELIVALSGSIDVVISDGDTEITITLNRANKGVYIPNTLWRRIENFSTNSFVLEMGSRPFDEGDYIRDYQQFKSYRESHEL